MPPRGRSKTQQSLSEESAEVESQTPKIPSPKADPAAVQTLIDDAIKRAHSSRGTTPRPLRRRTEQEGLICQAWHRLFGHHAVQYNTQLTSKLTDAVGMFLVVIFTFYFTAAGYMWYRETALGVK